MILSQNPQTIKPKKLIQDIPAFKRMRQEAAPPRQWVSHTHNRKRHHSRSRNRAQAQIGQSHMKHTPKVIYRDARDGQFVPEPWAQKHPNITEREVVYTPSPKRD